MEKHRERPLDVSAAAGSPAVAGAVAMAVAVAVAMAVAVAGAALVGAALAGAAPGADPAAAGRVGAGEAVRSRSPSWLSRFGVGGSSTASSAAEGMVLPPPASVKVLPLLTLRRCEPALEVVLPLLLVRRWLALLLALLTPPPVRSLVPTMPTRAQERPKSVSLM